MIINSANKFVDNMSWWISFFSVIFWVLALIPVCIYSLFFLLGGMRAEAFLFLVLGIVLYIGLAFLLHRLSMIGFEFMRSVVATILECQQELKNIKKELNKTPPDTGQSQNTPKPSPYNF